MSELIQHFEQVRQGTVNVYAVRYKQREKNKNTAIAIPNNGTYDWEIRSGFCDSISCFSGAREVAFNPISTGLDEGACEYVPLSNVKEKWDEIKTLFDNHEDYNSCEVFGKVPYSNMYVCVLTYQNYEYYLFFKQGSDTDKLLQGKMLFLRGQGEIIRKLPDEVFLLTTTASFAVEIGNDDESDNKVIIFHKKVFQDVFQYDDYLKDLVQRNIGVVNEWGFLQSAELIVSKSTQKNVYSYLAKVMQDPVYMEQIKNVNPTDLKNTLINKSSNSFTETDFDGDKLLVTPQNMETVLKMIAKGFKYNFFIDAAE